jgi:hypothetical protein
MTLQDAFAATTTANEDGDSVVGGVAGLEGVEESLMGEDGFVTSYLRCAVKNLKILSCGANLRNRLELRQMYKADNQSLAHLVHPEDGKALVYFIRGDLPPEGSVQASVNRMCFSFTRMCSLSPSRGLSAGCGIARADLSHYIITFFSFFLISQ